MKFKFSESTSVDISRKNARAQIQILHQLCDVFNRQILKIHHINLDHNLSIFLTRETLNNPPRTWFYKFDYLNKIYAIITNKFYNRITKFNHGNVDIPEQFTISSTFSFIFYLDITLLRKSLRNIEISNLTMLFLTINSHRAI
jgi:hypothetical protein